MVIQKTILRVSDNSGARTVSCVKVLGGFKKRIAVAGDSIIVSVQKLRNKAKKKAKVKRKALYKAIVVRTKSNIKNKDGSIVMFNNNAAVLVNKKGKPFGTRIIGPVSKKVNIKKNPKIFSLSPAAI